MNGETEREREKDSKNMFDEMETALVEAELGLKKEIKARRARMLHICECCVFRPCYFGECFSRGESGV